MRTESLHCAGSSWARAQAKEAGAAVERWSSWISHAPKRAAKDSGKVWLNSLVHRLGYLDS